MIPRILCNTEEYLVIDKPSSVHSVIGRSSAQSIADFLMNHYPECREASPNPSDCGLVNRLDYETSGILIAARSRDIWQLFHSLFTSGNVDKHYLCLVEGEVKQEISLSNFIGTPYRRAKKVKIYTSPPSKQLRALPALSRITPVIYHPGPDITAVIVKTSSGRRHQVRAHAAFSGHPLIGDSLYGSTRELAQVKPSRSFFLHAAEVRFTPPGKEEIRASSPVPEEFKDLFT